MESWQVLGDLVVMLAAALTGGLVFERLGMSAMLGYLAAGIVVGRSGIGLVADETTSDGIIQALVSHFGDSP